MADQEGQEARGPDRPEPQRIVRRSEPWTRILPSPVEAAKAKLARRRAFNAKVPFLP